MARKFACDAQGTAKYRWPRPTTSVYTNLYSQAYTTLKGSSVKARGFHCADSMTVEVSCRISFCTFRSRSTFFACPFRRESINAFCKARCCLLIRAIRTQSVKKCRETELMIVVSEPARRKVKAG